MGARAVIRGLALGFLVCLAGTGSAFATVTVGSDLAASSGSTVCADPSGQCTVQNITLNYLGAQVPAVGGYPGAGVIVRWRVRDASGQLRLRVTRTGPPGRTVVASGPTVTGTGTGVQTFDARIPVQMSDALLVDVLGGSIGYREHPAPPPGGNSIARTMQWSPPLVDGAFVTGGTWEQDIEYLYNADVEADSDRDGYGDETQDQCPGDAARQGPCSADLAVATTSVPTEAAFGANASYTFRVTNLGSSPAAAVVLTVTPPSGALRDLRPMCSGTSVPLITPPSMPPIGFLGCKVMGTQVVGSIGTLPSTAYASVTLRGVVTASGPLVVSATATTSTADPQPSNNTLGATTKVTLKRGACANRLSGTSKPDVLTGTPAGDRLSGGMGADTLFGKAGADCLDGGGGADRIDGGPGPDRLKGGPGKDTITGGSGNDTIDAKDGFVDKVNCGPGRDTVKADRRDVLKNCER